MVAVFSPQPEPAYNQTMTSRTIVAALMLVAAAAVAILVLSNLDREPNVELPGPVKESPVPGSTATPKT